MKIISNNITDPYYNAALEEYLLKSLNDDFLMMWQNCESVVIGKHQVLNAEVNHGFISLHNYPVVRRISGGGAVYHDRGNINISVFANISPGKPLNFSDFLEPLRLFLKESGIESKAEKNSLITVNGKISGFAASLYKNRVLFHSTLLFNSSLTNLTSCLRPDYVNYRGNFVKSNPKPTANAAGLFNKQITTGEFINLIVRFMVSYYKIGDSYTLSKADIEKVSKLTENKFRTEQWNLSYSPDYVFTKISNAGAEEYSVKLSVRNGIIEFSEISVQAGNRKEYILPENFLKGCPHSYISISHKLKQYNTGFAECMF